MWCLVFWVLWHLACCSQNTIAKEQQPIVTSHCLHVHWCGKRQRCVYRSLLNLVWHYKHVCVSAYMWRHKLGNYTRLNYRDWQYIYQKADGANAKRERCHHLNDQQITMGQAVFYGLLELNLAFSRCQLSIQIVRHALFKQVFKVVFRWNKFKRHTGCLSYVFIIQSMQWKASEMCFSMIMRCLNKMKYTDVLAILFHMLLVYNIRQSSDASTVHGFYIAHNDFWCAWIYEGISFWHISQSG